MANQSNSRSVKRTSGINANFLGLVVLGICILITGFNVGGNIKKLNKTIEKTSFSDTNNLNVPSEMKIGNSKYLTEVEAGEYLNLSTEKIIELITTGEITEYVKTDTGYSISVKVLDSWFDNEAYQMQLKHKTAATQEN